MDEAARDAVEWRARDQGTPIISRASPVPKYEFDVRCHDRFPEHLQKKSDADLCPCCPAIAPAWM